MLKVELLPVEDWYVLKVQTDQQAVLQNWGFHGDNKRFGVIEFQIYMVTEDDLTRMGMECLRMAYQMEMKRKSLDKSSTL